MGRACTDHMSPAALRVVGHLHRLGAADAPVSASVTSISDATALHRSTVHRAIALLEESAVIVRSGSARAPGAFRLRLVEQDVAAPWRGVMLAAGIQALRQADQPSLVGRRPSPVSVADVVAVLDAEGPICDDAVAAILSEAGTAVSRQTVSRRRAAVRQLASATMRILTWVQFTPAAATQIATLLVRIAEKNPAAAPPL